MTKPYYQKGNITIYHGDCLEIMPELGPVDLVVTDPPYGVGLEYGIYDDSPENLVSIIDGEGRSIEISPDMQSLVFSVISADQEKTFGNFPNPFGGCALLPPIVDGTIAPTHEN